MMLVAWLGFTRCALHCRYQVLQDKFSSKAETLKVDTNQAINYIEQCKVSHFLPPSLPPSLPHCLSISSSFTHSLTPPQDAYATELFSFLIRDKDFAMKIHKASTHKPTVQVVLM